jgi:serine protease Do
VKLQIATVTCFIAAAVGPAIALGQSPADRESAAAVAAIERTLVDAIGRAEPAVVAISRTAAAEPKLDLENVDTNLFRDLRLSASTNQNSSITGAGVIIDRTGLVLTHYLAVREGDQHTVTTIDGKTHDAAIRAADPRSALAVLAIQPARVNPGAGERAPTSPATFTHLRLGDAQKLRKGQFVIAVGNPYAIHSDGQPTASWGIVTNMARKAPANTNLNDEPGAGGDYRTTLHHLGTLIQTDARLGWSAAGAAIITMQGELIGITTTVASIAGHEQAAGYAIPINATFRRIIDTLKEGREVEYGMLGVTFGIGNREPALGMRQQVAVGEVFPGTPASQAGLETGDIVISVAGQPVHDIDAMQLLVSTLPPSTSTTIEYERGGRATAANVTLAKLAVAGKIVAIVQPENWRGIQVDYATALGAAELTQAIASGAYDAAGCVLVRKVEPDSTAWQAGVRPGMFISHVGGQRVSTPEEFLAAVADIGDRFDIRLTQPVESVPPEKDASSQNSSEVPGER